MEPFTVMFGSLGAILVLLFAVCAVVGVVMWIAAIAATEHFPESKAAEFAASLDFTAIDAISFRCSVVTVIALGSYIWIMA